MSESVFADGVVTQEEAALVTAQVVALDQKVLNDIRQTLLNVLQGYYDHVNFCQYLIDLYGEEEANRAVHGDGLATVASRDAHVVHIQEFEAVLRSLGVLRAEDYVGNPIALPVEAGDPENKVADSPAVVV